MQYICIIWDFPGSPVVKILPSNVGGAGSISDQVANKNPTCLAAKNRSRVVTNSIKGFKNGLHKKRYLYNVLLIVTYMPESFKMLFNVQNSKSKILI